jgi:hypothetical protein
MEHIGKEIRSEIVSQGGRKIDNRHQDCEGKTFGATWTVISCERQRSYGRDHRSKASTKTDKGSCRFIPKEQKRQARQSADRNAQVQQFFQRQFFLNTVDAKKLQLSNLRRPVIQESRCRPERISDYRS